MCCRRCPRWSAPCTCKSPPRATCGPRPWTLWPSTAAGKTSLAVDWIWRACVQQGKNVVVFTSETNRLQVRTKIIARHSRHLYAGDSRLPEGLNTKDLRGGNLPDDKTEFLRYTVNHFAE